MSTEKNEMDEAKSDLAEAVVGEGKEAMDYLEIEAAETESKGAVASEVQELTETIETEEKSDAMDVVTGKGQESTDDHEVEESVPLEAVVEEKNDVSEQAEPSSVHAEADTGAKPKENQNSSIRHTVRVKLLPDVQAIRTLLIYQNGTVQIFNSESQSEFEVNKDSMRWVTSYIGADSYIVLSYYGNNENNLSLLVFHPEVDSDKIFTTLKDTIEHKYTSMLEEVEGLVVENLKTTLAKQPIYMGWVETSVAALPKGSKVTETYWMLLDLESLCWYESLGGPLKHSLMFWKDESPNSVEIMRHNYTDEKFEIQTKTQSFTVPDLEEMDKALVILQPKEKQFLKKGKNIVEFFKTKAGFRNPIDFGHGQRTSPQAVRPSTSHYSRRQDVSNWEKPLSILRGELDNAETYLKDGEQFQIMWITYEKDLREMMEDPTIPKTEIESAGLCPENHDHLYKTMQDVEDMIKEDSLHLALSRMQACRRLFSRSEDEEIKEFFISFDDLTLLRKLYFKSLVD